MRVFSTAGVLVILTVVLAVGSAYGQSEKGEPKEPPGQGETEDAPVVVPESPQEKKALEELQRGKEKEGKYDEVHLDGNTIIRGRVVDLGGPTLRVEQKLGAVTILKSQIKPGGLRLASDPVADEASEDIVHLRGDRVIHGRVRVSADGKTVTVAVQASGQTQEVSFPREDVLKIDYAAERRKALKKRVESYEDSLAREIGEMVEALGSAEKGVWQAAREKLIKLGVFALDNLKEKLEELEEPAAGRVKEILTINAIKSYVPQSALDIFNMPGKKNLYERLVCAHKDERITTLHQLVLLEGENVVALLVYLAKKPDEAKEVRNFCLHSLAKIDCNDELVALLTGEEGWLNLAAALHLADNGIYAGAPHFISALGMHNPDVRRVAASRLRLASGKSFGFDPYGTPQERQAAIKKWEAWWKENEGRILRDTAKNLSSARISEEDRSFSQVYQKRGEEAWDRGALEEADKNFRRAIELDPSNLPARLSLAMFLYTQMGKTEEARAQMQVILRRYSDEAGSIMRKQALYHTALVDLSEGDWEGALHNLEAAIALDEGYADAYIALGKCYYVQATSEESISRRRLISLEGDEQRRCKERRTQVIASSVRALGTGLGLLDEEIRRHSDVEFRKMRRQREREVLERAGKKPDEMTRSKGEESYRKTTRRRKAQVCAMLADSYALQREFKKAAIVMNDAVRLVSDNPEYFCKLAFAQAAAGRRAAARQAFKRCLAIDPDNEKALTGLEDLK